MSKTQLVRLSDLAEVLLRQVHPHWIDPVRGLQSAAFCPGSNDEGMLSTLRGYVSAQETYSRATADGRACGAIFGVSVAEAETSELVCWDDTALPGTPEDHASIDFGERSRGKQRQASRKLRDAAIARGCLYGAAN